jgi:hypothetical protein
MYIAVWFWPQSGSSSRTPGQIPSIVRQIWWTHPTFPDRGTAYNSRSFAGNLLFVGDYGSWFSSTTIFTVSSIMLMWNLVKFWFPWQLLRFMRFSIDYCNPSLKKVLYKLLFFLFWKTYGPKVSRGSIGSFSRHSLFMGDNDSLGSNHGSN